MLAIDSKWCNWELGYGDAQKFKAHIALFPLKPKGSYDYLYKGAEYLSLYPYICYEDGTDKYDNGAYIQKRILCSNTGKRKVKLSNIGTLVFIQIIRKGNIYGA